MIKEILILDHEEELVLEKSDKTGKVYLTGIYTTADKKNKNNRIYSRKILDPEINKLSELAKQGRLTGELDHPKEITVSLANSSHKIEELSWDGNKVIGRSLIMGTSKGCEAAALIESGVQLGISSRSTGKVRNDKDTIHVEVLNMKTYDIVSNPSNYESHMAAVFESYVSHFQFEAGDNEISDDEKAEHLKQLDIQKQIRKNTLFKLRMAFYDSLKK